MIRRLSDLWDANPLGFWLVMAACLYFVVMAVRLTVIDIRSHLLPNRIVFPSYAVAGVLLLAAALVVYFADSTRSAPAAVVFGVPGLGVIAGGALLWLFYFILRLVHPPGMGFGGTSSWPGGCWGLYLGYLGWSHIFAGTFAAFLLGGLWSLGILVARRGTLRSAIPFGPLHAGRGRRPPWWSCPREAAKHWSRTNCGQIATLPRILGVYRAGSCLAQRVFGRV